MVPDTLGMILVHEEINTEQGVREAMLAVRGAPAGSARVQLAAPLDDTCTIAKFIDKRSPGIQQLACRVSDPMPSQSNCAPAAFACSMTHRGAAPRTPGSTSSTLRTPAAFWWNSSSPRTELRDRRRVGPRLARLRQQACLPVPTVGPLGVLHPPDRPCGTPETDFVVAARHR